jgi:sulfur carrier protein ThiS adenylyltransferase
MDLVDFDVVGVENLAPQAYWQSDLGKSKVEPTAHACRLLNPAVRIGEYNERFRRSSPRTLAAFADPTVRPVVFCCVDSIATRQLVWEAVRPMAAFFADGRMSAEVIRILAVGQPALDAYYATTLFAPEQAYQGSCTSRSTVYTASIAAALMLSQFTRSLREMPVDRDLHLNLLSSELSVH